MMVMVISLDLPFHDIQRRMVEIEYQRQMDAKGYEINLTSSFDWNLQTTNILSLVAQAIGPLWQHMANDLLVEPSDICDIRSTLDALLLWRKRSGYDGTAIQLYRILLDWSLHKAAEVLASKTAGFPIRLWEACTKWNDETSPQIGQLGQAAVRVNVYEESHIRVQVPLRFRKATELFIITVVGICKPLERIYATTIKVIRLVSYVWTAVHRRRPP